MESGPLLLGSERRELSSSSKPSEVLGEHGLEFGFRAGQLCKSQKTLGTDLQDLHDKVPPWSPWIAVGQHNDPICGAFPLTAQLCSLGSEHSTKAATRQACIVIMLVGCAFAVIMTATFFMYAATQHLGADEVNLGRCSEQSIANGIIQASVENSRAQVVCNPGFIYYELPRDVGQLACRLVRRQCALVRRKPVTDGEARHCRRTFAFALRQHALSSSGKMMGDEGTLDAARRAVEVALRGVCVPQPAGMTGSRSASDVIPVGDEATELSPNVSANAAGAGLVGPGRNVQPQQTRWTATASSAAVGTLLLTAISAVICAGISRGGFNDDSVVVDNDPDTAPLLDDEEDGASSDDADDGHKRDTLMPAPTAGTSNDSSGSDD